MRVRFLGLALAAGAGLVAGCSSGSSGGAVSGRVKFNGAPVADARVVFKDPAEGGSQYAAVTDDGGKFDLSGGSAAWRVKPGTYKVQVYKLVPKKGAKLPPDMDMDAEQMEASGMATNALPRQYAALTTTPLNATVTDGPNSVDLELQGK